MVRCQCNCHIHQLARARMFCHGVEFQVASAAFQDCTLGMRSSESCHARHNHGLENIQHCCQMYDDDAICIIRTHSVGLRHPGLLPSMVPVVRMLFTFNYRVITSATDCVSIVWIFPEYFHCCCVVFRRLQRKRASLSNSLGWRAAVV